ncbi:hypothetical protein FQN60_007221 [Etheostoma spectabile]|uniref:Uncharacterized protein n=1 Tax=Etheostoma spectabile TaxID=54343 RepID=A0A5J5CFH3_9PERO|nr:hypothetical protein FQN60_007221 [Etheostoma spectabile]
MLIIGGVVCSREPNIPTRWRGVFLFLCRYFVPYFQPCAPQRQLFLRIQALCHGAAVLQTFGPRSVQMCLDRLRHFRVHLLTCGQRWAECSSCCCLLSSLSVS